MERTSSRFDADHPQHVHRIEGRPIRMTPTTKPNLAWPCVCGWWRFVRGDQTWHPPASDEQIRLRWLERLEGHHG